MNAKKLAKKYAIGDNVQISQTVCIETNEAGCRCVRRKEDHSPGIFGKIIGLKRFFLGDVEGGGYGMDEGGSVNYLLVDRTIVVWEIRRGYLNKPIYAFDKDVQIVDVLSPAKKFPLIWQRQWSETAKQSLRDEMKDAPRDAKGRWTWE